MLYDDQLPPGYVNTNPPKPPPPHTISKAIWAAETALVATLNLSEDRQMYALMVIQSVASRVGLAVRFRELDSARWQVEISPMRR